MKVIVTGATGSAGQGIVEACLADERVTKVIIVTRRNVAGDVESNDKVEVVLHTDFSQYPDELMSRLEGAEACLWAVGGTVRQFNGDADLARKVGVDYTLAGAKAMRDKLAPKVPGGKPFRFIFVSGVMAVWDQDKPLYFMSDTRRIKGSVEKGLSELADEKGEEGKFEVFVARPAALIGKDTPAWKAVFSPVSGGLKTVQLGKAMISLAVDGGKERFVELAELRTLAKD